MKKFILLFFSALIAIATQAQDLAITMTTEMEIGSDFAFSISANADNTTIQVDWGDGSVNDFNVGTSHTLIDGILAGNTVKVYGNGIVYLSNYQLELTGLDVSRASSLKQLYCDNNNLTTLDFSSNTNLETIYCPHNELTSINVSQCASLKSLQCFTNLITSLDVSANINLTELDCGFNQLSTLDASNNTLLTSLNCSSNKLTEISIPAASNLTELSCYNNKLTSIDVSSLTSLQNFDCNTNQLITLDLSANSNLVYLFCNKNQLTSLDLSGKPYLFNIDCSNNLFNLATLPLEQSGWGAYTYSPQTLYSLPKKIYAIGETVDLSSQLTVNSVNTVYTWKTQGGQTLTSGTDYTETNGVFTFNSGYSDSLYCEMTNTNFPNLTLTSTAFEVPLPKPAITMTTTTPVGSSFSFDITANADNTPIQVDWGDGNTTNHTIGTNAWTTVNGTLEGDTIKVYGIGISNLDVNSLNLTTLDVTNAKSLTILDCEINQITSLDLSNNLFLNYLRCGINQITNLNLSNNVSLKHLYCDWNKLTILDVTKNTELDHLACGLNKLTSLNLINNTALTYLDFGYNKITTIDLSNQTLLSDLSCLDNLLISLDLSKLTTLSYLDSRNNQLTYIDISNNLSLNSIMFNNNQFNFSTLPVPKSSWSTYTYSPQALLKLAKTEYALNKEVDLSSQLTAGGNTTVYTWKTAGGNTLAKDVDYMELNGKFYFQKSYSDSIYCEMTNATFPDLTLETSKIVITVTSPSVSMATIKTIGNNFGFNINAASDNTPLLVDWGDGSITSYTIGKSTTSISGTLAGDTVKFWAPGVEYLDVSYLKLTVLDVSNTPTLKNLSCDMDDISELDLSKNDSLYNLSCPTNQLTSLILPNTGKLKYISCQYNYLTFANLPLVNPNWFYSYSPQEAMKMGKSEYGIGEVIDLSNQLNINGNVTSYTWVAESGNTLVKDVDYMENNGKFTFVAEQTESVYCQMTNDEFPDLTLETDHIWITLSSPNVAFATTQTLGSELSFNVSSNEDNSCIIVDWGDGSITKYTYGKSNTSITGTLAGDTVKIYGSGISSLDAGSKNLTYLYVSGAQYLQILICNSNQIDTLDVTNNSNLRYLDFRVNKLKYIDLSKNNVLETFLGNANMLTDLNLANNTSLKTLDCQSNQISSLNLSSNDSLQTLWCSYNNLSELNISNDTLLKLLYCSGNKISTLDVSNNLALSELRCENNNLTFVSLPLKEASWITYSYTPQNNVILPKKQYGLTETVDLSSELTVNGNTTNFAWKTKGGTALTVGIDYTITNGVTTFLKVQTDSVYCKMTNATFPDLTLKTSNILISQFPLSVPDNEVLFKVYPNPAFNYLNIELPEGIVRVEIFNEPGVKVYEHNFNTNKVTVPTSNIPKGMLIVKVYTKKEVYNGKVMKL